MIALALPRGRAGARAALLAAALAAVALLAVGAKRAVARALDRREAVLRDENAWLRARLAAIDARLRALERSADVSAATVPHAEGEIDRAPPSTSAASTKLDAVPDSGRQPRQRRRNADVRPTAPTPPPPAGGAPARGARPRRPDGVPA